MALNPKIVIRLSLYITFAIYFLCIFYFLSQDTKRAVIARYLGERPFACYINSGKETGRTKISKDERGSIDRVVLNSCGKSVYIYEAIPKTVAKTSVIVIALHQTTNYGKDEVMGFDGDSNLSYGRTFFENGFIVISPDVFVAGENYSPATGWDTAPFYREFPKWSAMGRMLQDDLAVSRYVEYKYPSNCVAAVGHSLGGHNALFLGAFVEKIDDVVSSAGFESISLDENASRWARDSWFVYMPLLKPYLSSPPPRKTPWDFDDLLKLIAPRPILVFQGLNDGTWTNPESASSLVSWVNQAYIHPPIEGVFHAEGHKFGYQMQLQSVDFLKKYTCMRSP